MATVTTEIHKIQKRLKTLLKSQTYAEAAKTLNREGYRTPSGKRPNRIFVNHVVTRCKLAGISAFRTQRVRRKLKRALKH